MKNFIYQICERFCYFYKKEKQLDFNEKCGSFKFLVKNPSFFSYVNSPKKEINPKINKKIIELFCKNYCDYYIKDCDWTNLKVKNKISPCGGYYFINDLFNKYVVLNRNFSLKFLENTYLFDKKNDELYELDNNAIDFFLKCSGEYKLYQIIKDFQSLVYLLKNDIIYLSNFPSKRIINLPQIHPPKPTLRYLEIQLTSLCNLQCKHCYLGGTENIHIDFNLLKRILDEFEYLQGLRVIFSGGEPFLYKDISKLIEILNDYTFRKVFLSNGTIIKEEFLKNIDEIQVSIDGLEDSHDFIRGKGTFKKILKNIKKIKEKNIDLSVATMIHKRNLYEFDKLEKFIKSLNVKEWGIDVPVITGNLKKFKYLSVSPEEAVIPLSKKFGGSFHEPVKNYGCGVHLATVFPNGKIAKCGFYYNSPFGDLKKETLSSALQKRRFVYLSELDCFKIDCKFIEDCRGGCRFRAGNNFTKDEYMCSFYYSISNKKR